MYAVHWRSLIYRSAAVRHQWGSSDVATRNYYVEIGMRTIWFATREDAESYCRRYFAKCGVVLGIQAVRS